MKNRAVIKRRGTHIRQISCKTLFIAKSPFIAKTLFLKKRCFSFSWEKSKTIIRKKGRFAEKGMAFQKRSFLMTDVFQIGVAHCRRFQNGHKFDQFLAAVVQRLHIRRGDGRRAVVYGIPRSQARRAETICPACWST
ncbi:MAG: hypothetical protein K6F46_06725 [Desulfovibrio sp.]|nr:hypothetical protein [Desulfovibrio sp.]